MDRPYQVAEDCSPFVVEWGLRKRDTVAGHSKAAVEWSKHVVTPRDRAHIVQSSQDEQVELLGCQAIASVCLLLSSNFRPFQHKSVLLTCSFGDRQTPISRRPFTTSPRLVLS